MQEKMSLQQFISDKPEWFWSIFNVGIGFTFAAIAVCHIFFIHGIRTAAEKGFFSKSIGEFLVKIMLLPTLISLFAILYVYRHFDHLVGNGDTFFLFPITACSFIGLAWYVNRKAF
jgi:hypothetical protein